MKIIVSVSATHDYDELDQKIDDLHREATHYKKTDLELSISYLKEAKELMQGKDNRLIEQWLRLPLFLQQSGRFDEAMVEFNLIIKNVRPRAEKRFGFLHQPTRIKLCITSEKLRIYEKMQLACKREKLPEMAKKYASLYNKCRMLHDGLSKKLAQEEDAKLARATKYLSSINQ
ncbi:hypothetical protein [Methylovulum psychrotolerans]|uniref:Tetratricopeptide repeat protein n=1 Tax=Methylovulum psychrotolerans TaxID=1704499 RepID=A0A2S5CKJ4_9GAMM|nr:hypothetical protein [Methylovulum psychrotolerans]POZ51331.1 hypothetical protein AADEFJLK_02779 [Methylovulum psychrotolerans]